MTDIRARVAYLHGLAEGLDIDTGSPEGRLISSMIDVLGDLAEQLTDVTEAQTELAEYVEDVDYDLGALEESVYLEEDEDEEDDDDLEHVRFIPEELMMDEEDGVEMILCPQCGETLAAGAGEIDTELDVVCPTCGCAVCGAELEFDEDLMMERD